MVPNTKGTFLGSPAALTLQTTAPGKHSSPASMTPILLLLPPVSCCCQSPLDLLPGPVSYRPQMSQDSIPGPLFFSYYVSNYNDYESKYLPRSLWCEHQSCLSSCLLGSLLNSFNSPIPSRLFTTGQHPGIGCPKWRPLFYCCPDYSHDVAVK